MNAPCWSIVKLLVAWSVLLSKTAGASSQTKGTITMPLGIFGAGVRETALGNTWVGYVYLDRLHNFHYEEYC